LHQEYQNFVRLNTEIVVIGSENADIFQKYWLKQELPFIGIPDPEHTIQQLYGQEVNPFKLGRLPAQMLVDLSGRLRYVHYGSSMADIPSCKEILDLLKIE